MPLHLSSSSLFSLRAQSPDEPFEPDVLVIQINLFAGVLMALAFYREWQQLISLLLGLGLVDEVLMTDFGDRIPLKAFDNQGLGLGTPYASF